jgi:hypothetical protein
MAKQLDRQFFFVVGAPRSGTTMLQQALNRHSQIAIPPETAFFTFLGRSHKGQRLHLQRINEDLQITLPMPARRIACPEEGREWYQQLASLYLQRHQLQHVTHFGEKSPEHQRRLGRIRQLFPDARMVLLYRDGRDVALSLTRLPWMSSDLYVNFALWLHYYRLQVRAQKDAPGNLCCVRYEDLVAKPQSELSRILDFLGLPHEPQVAGGCGNSAGVPEWEYAWKGQALENITRSRVGTWRTQLSAEQTGILERWGGRALRSLGYELVTDGRHPLPLLFFPRVYWRALRWLLGRPPYWAAREHWGSEPVRPQAEQSIEPSNLVAKG